MATPRGPRGFGYNRNPAAVYEKFTPSSEWKQEIECDILLIFLPDFVKQNLRVTTEPGNIVRVTGERQVGEKVSRFQEDFEIPRNCIIKSIRAKFEGGILTITFPRVANTAAAAKTTEKAKASQPNYPTSPPSQKQDKKEPTSQTTQAASPDIPALPTPVLKEPTSQITKAAIPHNPALPSPEFKELERSRFQTPSPPKPAKASNFSSNTQADLPEDQPRKFIESSRPPLVVAEYSNQCERNYNSSNQELGEPSACASASATFCRGKDNTMMTWASFESPQSPKSKSAYEDSAFLDDRETQDTKGEANESRSTRQTRRSRIASVHNQSERRRREKINQKMKALQKLVPNANKTDKASMLDEVIVYLKQLQAQVHMMSMRNNMPQMMMPLGIQQQQLQQQQLQQQQLQMSLLARMGMGFGLGMNTGMLDMSSLAQCFSPLIPQNSATPATPNLVPQPFVSPPIIKRHISPEATPTQGASNTSVPFNDPYCAFLAQSMNLELYNKMAAYHQQVNQAAQALHGDKKSNQLQGE